MVRGALVIASAIALSACGLILGVEPLEVEQRSSDGGKLGPKTEAGGGAITDTGGTGPVYDGDVLVSIALPPAGRFKYTVESGHEQLDGLAPPYYLNYGNTVTVAFEYTTNGCMTMSMNLRSAYSEVSTLCVRGRELVRTRIVRDQTFPLVGQVILTFDCPNDPLFRDPAAGASWPHSCVGQMNDVSGDPKFTSEGTYRFVEEQNIEINGVQERVAHFEERRTHALSQRGTWESEFFFAADGRLVRMVRNINVKYDSNSLHKELNYIEQETLMLVGPTEQ